jgi:hypothetical protein
MICCTVYGRYVHDSDYSNTGSIYTYMLRMCILHPHYTDCPIVATTLLTNLHGRQHVTSITKVTIKKSVTSNRKTATDILTQYCELIEAVGVVH